MPTQSNSHTIGRNNIVNLFPQNLGPKLKSTAKLIITYVFGVLTPIVLQHALQYNLVNVNASSQVEAFKVEQRGKLLREIAEGNEAIMDAETKFLLASEIETMKGAARLIATTNGTSEEDAEAKIEIAMRRLGLSAKGAVFAESAEKYMSIKQNLIGTLSSIDLYFSNEVSRRVTPYRAHIRNPEIQAQPRSEYWLMILEDIMAKKISAHQIPDMVSQALSSAKYYNQLDRSRTIDLYNQLYHSMREEIDNISLK